MLHPQIQDKLVRATNYYQHLTSNSSSRNDLDAGKFKWGGKEPISLIQKELVLHLSGKIDLDEKQAFDLADLYFARNPSIFAKLMKHESVVQSFSQSIQQPTMPATQDLRRSKLAEYNDELRAFVASLVTPMIELYYEERLALLKAEVAIATAATNKDNPLQKDALSCIDALFQNKEYENAIWTLLYDYKNKINSKHKLNLEEKERYCEQLMREEFTILQIFFVLYFQLRTMKADTYLKMLTHFNETQYQV